jgi:hypothetical protein
MAAGSLFLLSYKIKNDYCTFYVFQQFIFRFTGSLMSRKILFLGSSHIGCIEWACKNKEVAGLEKKNSYFFKSIMDFKNDSRIIEPVSGDFNNYHLNQELESWLLSSERFDSIIVSISGSDYLGLCISNSSVPWDFICPQVSDSVLTNRKLVPYAEVHNKVRDSIRHSTLGIKEIKRILPDSNVCYLEPPPPNGDNLFLIEHLTWAQPLVDATGLSEPGLRLKLWHVQNQLIRDACDQSQVPFIALPDSCKDSQGFMIKECFGPDLMHGNLTFGELIFNQFELDL